MNLRIWTNVGVSALLAAALFTGGIGLLPGTSVLGPAPKTAEAASCDVGDIGLSTREIDFVGFINAYRAQIGAPQLEVIASLTQTSTWMAQDMARSGVLSHTDSLGRWFVARQQD